YAAAERQLPAKQIGRAACRESAAHQHAAGSAARDNTAEVMGAASEVQRGIRRHIEAAVADAPAAKRQGARIDIDHAGASAAAGVVEPNRDVGRARAALGVGAGI